MALIDSKQLDPKFSGSFILSGSTQSLISDQVVIGTYSGSATAHPSASLTVLMGPRSGMMLPSASADPTGLGATEEGMMYFNTTDGLLKLFDGSAWIPQVILILKILILQCPRILTLMVLIVPYFLE